MIIHYQLLTVLNLLNAEGADSCNCAGETTPAQTLLFDMFETTCETQPVDIQNQAPRPERATSYAFDDLDWEPVNFVRTCSIVINLL